MKGLLACFVLSAVAGSSYGNNDCCFDPNLPLVNGNIQCAPAAGQATCFNRAGQQIFVADHTCVVDSLADDGSVPGVGNGFQCEEKPSGDQFGLMNVSDQCLPAMVPGGLTVQLISEAGLEICPATSTWGLTVLALAALTSGTLIVVRRRAQQST